MEHWPTGYTGKDPVFKIEQEALAPLSAAIAGQRAIRANDPVARYDDCNPILPIGRTHCAA